MHSNFNYFIHHTGGFCVNTKVPLCCASNPEVYTTDNLTFVNTTTLRVVRGQDITVTIFQNKGGITMHDCMMVNELIQVLNIII